MQALDHLDSDLRSVCLLGLHPSEVDAVTLHVATSKEDLHNKRASSGHQHDILQYLTYCRQWTRPVTVAAVSETLAGDQSTIGRLRRFVRMGATVSHPASYQSHMVHIGIVHHGPSCGLMR